MSDESAPLIIRISYEPDRQLGKFTLESPSQSTIWSRLQQAATAVTDEYSFTATSITVPWPAILSIIREHAANQRRWSFRFKPEDDAKAHIERFLAQYRAVRAACELPPAIESEGEIIARLKALGFTRRELTSFQIRDLRRLLALKNGANFSVPGAGKTTVTFALHLLTRVEGGHLLVVGPKSAFPAWMEIVDECIGDGAPEWVREPFTILRDGADAIRECLHSGATRFLISYDQLIMVPSLINSYLLQHPVHIVLDEAHRMKGGRSVRRGSVLLNMATLPVRRDILTGTPMPQSASDLQALVDFLWPASGLGLRIAQGASPRSVIGNLYVRTTKADLNLPPERRKFIHVGMGRGQAALYGVVRSEVLRDLSSLRAGSGVDVVSARRSVMRLLQLSANPVLALRSIMSDAQNLRSGIVRQVLEDGPSPKMIAVRDLARKLAREGRKCVIWTIFTDTVEQLERMLADLNPVTVFGEIRSGEVGDHTTREGRIERFKNDPACMAFIANPAAAGEGISLHTVCHDAIYLDRSYNTTHYLQSLDRIHRLGLPAGTETNVYVFQTTAPKGLGCIDHSVSRRLATKLRALVRLLDDEDIHRIALDEENAQDPIDYDTDPDDLADLIDELEGRVEYSEDRAV